MKLNEIEDQESFVYIKAVVALSNKFKVGDYVKSYSFDNYDDEGEELSSPRWSADQRNIGSFHSRIDSRNNFYVKSEIIYKITMISDGYIEAKEVKLQTDGTQHLYYKDESSNLIGYSLKDEIENHLCDVDDDTDADDVVSFFVNNYIQLDEDYADSIIMESEYFPYSNSVDIKSQLLKVEALRLAEEKELLRRARVKGWETRRKNIAAKKKREAIIEKAIRASKVVKKTIKRKK